MKKLVYDFTAGLLFLALLVSAAPLSAAADYTKTIKKEFDITNDGTTSITNKYGKVDIKTWDRNRVKIDVTIIVRASSESRAQEVFDRIAIDFSNSSNYVKAVTEIEPQKTSFWSWSTATKSDYSINYEVFLPPGNSLELDHKYGDAYVSALKGKGNITIKYGNLKAEGFERDANLYLGYSNGALEKTAALTADVSYGKLICNEAGDASLITKYSKIIMEQAGSIRCESKYDSYELGNIRSFKNVGKYDNIRIGKVNEIGINARYTELSLKELTQKMELEMQYGGASIEKLSRNFSSVYINGSYTGFKIGIERGSNFQFDAETNYAGIGYPSDMNVTYEYEKGSDHTVRGYIGANNASAIIKARLNYGGLKVFIE